MAFLATAARCFHRHGCHKDACSICELDSSDDGDELLAIKLEILGSMGQHSEMWALVHEVQ